jgi:hypothetical protein
MRSFNLIHVMVVSSIFAVSPIAYATVVSTTNNEVGTGATGWTPSYVVSTTDLINGATPTASAGNFQKESVAGLPVLTNGTFGSFPDFNSSPTVIAASGGDGGSGGGASVTYSLGANPLGYNLTSIDVYGGWSNWARDAQAYTIVYSTASDPTNFSNTLITVGFDPSPTSGAIGTTVQSAIKISITDNASSILASNVAAVRFNFAGADAPGTYTGYMEIDVLGSAVAVPEPQSALLLLIGSMFFARRRRG